MCLKRKYNGFYNLIKNFAYKRREEAKVLSCFNHYRMNRQSIGSPGEDSRERNKIMKKRAWMTAALLAGVLMSGGMTVDAIVGGQEPQQPSFPEQLKTPYPDVYLERFTDKTYGFSFLYPRNDGMLSQNQVRYGVEASEYAVTVSRLEMTLWYGAYFGGIRQIGSQYQDEIHSPQVYTLLDSKKGGNWFTLKYKDGYGRITEAKYYYGRDMHQRIMLRYPEQYAGDPTYEEFIALMFREFKPRV